MSMNNRVLPFFDDHGVQIRTVLSVNGREFCGRPDRDPYEIFLQIEDIEHRTTKVRRPQSTASSSASTGPCSTRCRPASPTP